MNTPTTEPKQIAQYQIRREIGRGGMSVVYEAEDTQTARIVALKLLTLPPSLSPAQQSDLIARFRREARAVAGLSHPNIVVIYEVGEDAGTYFLAMERLTGYTLRDRLADGPLTPAQTAPIVTEIAAALDAVHQAGIVHRDVKPSNVMFLPDGTAKLLDFGIARQTEDTAITRTDVLVGSPAYMAPEQVQGEMGTTASDVWALGVLAYQMLAGHPPFEGKNIPAVLYQVTHQSPPPISGLPPAIQKVLRRALDKNPALRPPTASAFAADLRAALAAPAAPGRALSSWPPPSGRRAVWLLLLPLLLAGVWLGRQQRAPHPAVPPARTPSAVALPPLVPVPAAPAKIPTRPAALPVTAKRVPAAPAPPRRSRSAKALPRSRRIVRATRRAALPPRSSRLPRREQRPPRPNYHPPGGEPEKRFDPAAAARLQRFIWPEGR